MTHLTVVAVALICLLPVEASAQYRTSQQLEADAEERRAREHDAEAQRWVGKTFWYRPKPTAEFRAEIFDELPKDYPPRGNRFLPERTTSFVVLALVRSGSEALRGVEPQYAHVRFPDGKEGFVPFEAFSSQQAIRGMPELDFEERFYAWDPSQKAPRRTATASAKSGVSIGMTESQVLASSWGRPRRTNRVTSAKGTMEAWYYEGSNALVFVNGKVYMIHN
jgi:hypothetical protein